jgi:hypothetical protein
MTLYRYEDVSTTAGVKVYLRRYFVRRETECYWFINDRRGLEKRVKKDARKQFACESIEVAALSYKYRKARQVRLLRARLKHAEEAQKASLPDH